MGSNNTLAQVREIDNSRLWLPVITTLLIFFLVFLAVWFFQGGSFKLYASIFFLIYSVTHQVWLSVILIGVTQNLLFMPLRMIGNRVEQPLKDFEDELDVMNQSDQYLVFSKKIKEGSLPILFYVFNFFINAIAFCSAGRIFLIDFYNFKLDPKYLYKFVPYPKYPLHGTDFHFPFLQITDTIAIKWSTIFLVILSVILFFSALRLVWRLLRFLLWKNKNILNARINYNRLLLKIGGFGGTLIILFIFFMRHIPTAFKGIVFTVDLTRQNTPMNFVTAIGTFITTIHAGYKNNSLVAKEAHKNNIPEEIIVKVFKEKMRQSLKNALILGGGAFFVTNQIPSAFELSVATFEVVYMVYPYTFGKLLSLTSAPKHAAA